MESKYIRECRRLMKLTHKELVEVYKNTGFSYCGGSKRRKLRMASRIVIQHFNNYPGLKTYKRRILDAIAFLERTGRIKKTKHGVEVNNGL